jgi:hypothetical protein
LAESAIPTANPSPRTRTKTRDRGRGSFFASTSPLHSMSRTEFDRNRGANGAYALLAALALHRNGRNCPATSMDKAIVTRVSHFERKILAEN